MVPFQERRLAKFHLLEPHAAKISAEDGRVWKAFFRALEFEHLEPKTCESLHGKFSDGLGIATAKKFADHYFFDPGDKGLYQALAFYGALFRDAYDKPIDNTLKLIRWLPQLDKLLTYAKLRMCPRLPKTIKCRAHTPQGEALVAAGWLSEAVMTGTFYCDAFNEPLLMRRHSHLKWLSHAILECEYDDIGACLMSHTFHCKIIPGATGLWSLPRVTAPSSIARLIVEKQLRANGYQKAGLASSDEIALGLAMVERNRGLGGEHTTAIENLASLSKELGRNAITVASCYMYEASVREKRGDSIGKVADASQKALYNLQSHFANTTRRPAWYYACEAYDCDKRGAEASDGLRATLHQLQQGGITFTILGDIPTLATSCQITTA